MQGDGEDGRPGLTPLNAAAAGGLGAKASFSLSNRIFRAIWAVGWLVLARWTPAPLHAWRRWVLRLFGAKLAPGTRVAASARIWYPPNLTMRAGAALGENVNCYDQGPIEIGRKAVVSRDCHLVSGTHDVDNKDFQLFVKPVVVGDHAFVGSGAYIGPGVRVGEGAVLAARSVAAKSLDAWTHYAGNPVRPIGLRDRPADLA